MGLACIVLHKLCIDKGGFTPTKLDLTSDHMTNACWERAEPWDVLHLTNSNRRDHANTGIGGSSKIRNTI